MISQGRTYCSRGNKQCCKLAVLEVATMVEMLVVVAMVEVAAMVEVVMLPRSSAFP